MSINKEGEPLTTGEARLAANRYGDEYLRWVILTLADEVDRLRDALAQVSTEDRDDS